MRMSESIQDLAKSLVTANKTVGNPKKNAINPHLKNKYATLDAVIFAYKESYLSNGITVLENPKTEDGRVGVEITLLHETGQYITHDPFMLPPGKNDAQGHGSAVTYARRYALSAVMNISADDDDDGNGAQQKPQGQQSKPPYKKPSSETPKDNGMISPAQIKALGTKTGIIAKANGEEQKTVYENAIKVFGITKSTRELTKGEASKIIDYLGTLEG